MPRKDAESTGNRQAADLLKLLEMLQSTRIGLTVSQLMEKTGKSRRSIERLLHELKKCGDQFLDNNLDTDHHLTRRYKLSGVLPASILRLNAVDQAALESLLETLPSGSERRALTKLLASQNMAGVSASIDQETLINRVAYLGRVGPKTTIPSEILTTIEKCIQGFERLSLVYRTSNAAKLASRTVEPLGLIYSRFGYLVARQGRTLKTFRFELIEDVQRTGEIFDAKNFNLKAWAAESFGVYHGDDLKTHHITFSPRVADRAAGVQFHPSERKMRLADGSLLVILRCRGHRELLHEMQHPDWQGEVTIS